MAMREQRDMSIHSTDFCNNSIGANADFERRFTARAAIAKNRPVRVRLSDFLRRESFVLTVIPLHKITVYRRNRTKTGELAGFTRSLKRAGQNQCKFFFRDNRLQQSGDPSTVL